MDKYQDLNKEEAFEEMAKVMMPFFIPNKLADPKYNSINIPFFVTDESIAETASLALESDDVFIVTYPKAGTTWTQQIVKLIRNKGESDGIQLQASIPWAEANSDKNPLKTIDLSAIPKPRAFKSHMPYGLMPCGEPHTTPCKYIFVMRNPKDTAVSYYFHHTKLGVKQGCKIDWNIFFRNFVHGSLGFGDYFDHLLSWWPHREDENVLFLTFEDMKKDLPTAVARVAKFIGADLSDEERDKVATLAAFDSMKKDDTANNAPIDKMSPGTTPFMRKGEVGDWKNHLSPEQSAEIDRLCEERLKGTGITFDFGV